MLYDQETNLMREVYYENPDLKYAYKQNDYDQLGRFYKEQLKETARLDLMPLSYQNISKTDWRKSSYTT